MCCAGWRLNATPLQSSFALATSPSRGFATGAKNPQIGNGTAAATRVGVLPLAWQRAKANPCRSSSQAMIIRTSPPKGAPDLPLRYWLSTIALPMNRKGRLRIAADMHQERCQRTYRNQ
jgi:hypothetical protein